MHQSFVKSNGKTYLVNCPGGGDEGIGPGFAVGQLIMRSATDNQWYIVTSSGSAGSVVTSVNQTPLPFITGSDGTSYLDQNFPYQLVASLDGNAYAVFLTGTAPNATFTISQSAWGKSYITNSLNAIIDMAKPNLYLQNTTDGNYYTFYLSSSGGTTTLVSDGQTPSPPVPPTQLFSYEPSTAEIYWTDVNGSFGPADRATFLATANIASVSAVTLNDGAPTSVSNLSQLSALTQLDIDGNSLTSLDASGLTALVTLNCKLNMLTTLDVTGDTALSNLDCSSNTLTTLDVSTNTALVTLRCDTNALTTLDVSTNTALVTLICSSNTLTTLDVTNTAMVTLYCDMNTLTTLDATGNTAMVTLHCESNALTTLDVSTNTAMVTLICVSNALTTASVNAILSDLVANGQVGGYVDCSTQTPAAPPSVGPPNGIVAAAALLTEVPAWVVVTD